MTPSQTDLKAIFLGALDRTDGSERAAYLVDACRGEASVRAQVEELLEAHVRAGVFLTSEAETATGDDTNTAALEATALRTAAATTSPGLEPAPQDLVRHGPIAEGPGSRIGPYTIVRKLGEGGMGIVFLAEQERPVRRKVALKVIKPGMDTEQIVSRFEAERQALALMDHPGIARVLDAGATESGRPFFVMELVDGVPINEYCDRERLALGTRLELFVAVCRSIEHAHQRGVIHRDIKPSNVLVALVDGQPMPKVIDFGVAKAIDQRLTERTLFTQFGVMVGTPEYMSPEQAGDSGAAIDTRSDVYALGVLLYELLTGTTPLGPVRLLEAAFSEVLRRIREEEPPRPSTRLSGSGEALASIAACRDIDPAQMTRLVRGELDWITMKALHKDRRQRYATAVALGQDVQRYLDDEPVEASPPSMLYRAGKLMRKHRAAILTVAGAVLMLAGSALVTAWLLPRAAHDARPAAATTPTPTPPTPMEPRWILKDHTDVAWCVAFAPDGKTLVTCAGNRGATAGELLGYRLDAGKPVPAYRAQEPHGIRWVAFAADGKSMATAEYDGMIRIRDPATGKVLTQWFAHDGGAQCVKFTRDGRMLVSCGKDGKAKVWDVATREVKTTMAGSAEHLYSLDLSHDEKTLLTGASDATAVQWNVETGESKGNFTENKGPIEGVRYSPNGTLMAVAGWEGVVSLWGATTGARVRSLPGPGGGILALAFTPDGRRLLGGTELGQLQLWDVATGAVLSTTGAHDGNIRAIGFSPDGKLMATASHDWTIKIWDSP
jgi:serine/threonine protein kinase